MRASFTARDAETPRITVPWLPAQSRPVDDAEAQGSFAEASAAPRTWLLLGRKPGDNGQVLALAEALGWPFEVKRLVYRPTELLTNRLLGITLLGIDRRRSSPLEPPWPELVITAGRRNEPVARWIQRQAGGPERCRLVHVGRPWAPLDAFDLIVTTPQYALPQHPRILHTEAPMHRVSPSALADAAARWRPQLADLPEPRIAVMLGGHVGPWTFDERQRPRAGPPGQRHGQRRRRARCWSRPAPARRPRWSTPSPTSFGVPHRLYRWRPDDPDNPYLGFLALAERIIVTSDSMSMLVEAIATAKPVLIFDLAEAASKRPLAAPSAPTAERYCRACAPWSGIWVDC